MTNSIKIQATPPPPPPETTTAPTAPAKGSSKKLLAIIAIIIIVVAIAAGAFLLMGSKPSGGTNPSASPTSTTSPGASSTASASASPTASATNQVGTAQSIRFSAKYTSASPSTSTMAFDYTFSAKNIGTPNMMIRVEGNIAGQNVVYIVNGATKKAWISTADTWIDLSTEFASEWSSWDNTWEGFKTNLDDWAGSGDITYNVGGDSVRIYNISVNPALDDSLFTHT
jgi:hypothetical protein